MWQVILIVTALVFLITASYSDLKKREVPDWLSYGLIFSGLGLRLIFSFGESWGIFLNGVFGFLICLGIAYLFYYTGQWGGGDSKLLMGMGAVIGLGVNFGDLSLNSFDFSLLLFFLGLLFFGAVVGLLWSSLLAVREREKFVNEFKKTLSSVKKWHFLALLVSVIFLGLSLFYQYLWPFALLSAGGFYLLCFVKAVEKSCFVKELPINKLVEGDWLAKDVVVDKKKIVEKGNGLEKKDIWKMMSLQGEGKLKTVLVKEGIPFVPSFLAAYLMTVLGGWSWLIGF